MILAVMALYLEYYRFWMFDFLLLISANLHLAILLIAIGSALHEKKPLTDLTLIVMTAVCFNILLNSIYTSMYLVFFIPASYLYIIATAVGFMIMSIKDRLFVVEVAAITSFSLFMNIVSTPMTIPLSIVSTVIVAQLTYLTVRYLMTE